ncbi:hypothetical protein, partial [Clostridium perfringens]|uniref:hypothetical protein n=1 Tax=Clostridium perfringens TaxID=1502 RepID=UPI002468B5B9
KEHRRNTKEHRRNLSPKTRMVEPFNFLYININININRGSLLLRATSLYLQIKKEKNLKFLEDFLNLPIIY